MRKHTDTQTHRHTDTHDMAGDAPSGRQREPQSDGREPARKAPAPSLPTSHAHLCTTTGPPGRASHGIALKTTPQRGRTVILRHFIAALSRLLVTGYALPSPGDVSPRPHRLLMVACLAGCGGGSSSCGSSCCGGGAARQEEEGRGRCGGGRGARGPRPGCPEAGEEPQPAGEGVRL